MQKIENLQVFNLLFFVLVKPVYPERTTVGGRWKPTCDFHDNFLNGGIKFPHVFQHGKRKGATNQPSGSVTVTERGTWKPSMHPGLNLTITSHENKTHAHEVATLRASKAPPSWHIKLGPCLIDHTNVIWAIGFVY